MPRQQNQGERSAGVLLPPCFVSDRSGLTVIFRQTMHCWLYHPIICTSSIYIATFILADTSPSVPTESFGTICGRYNSQAKKVSDCLLILFCFATAKSNARGARAVSRAGGRITVGVADMRGVRAGLGSTGVTGAGERV